MKKELILLTLLIFSLTSVIANDNETKVYAFEELDKNYGSSSKTENAEYIQDDSWKCNGCTKDGYCYPKGYRISELYCSNSSNFEAQLILSFPCENDFECESNSCKSNQCTKKSVFRKVIDWFGKYF